MLDARKGQKRGTLYMWAPSVLYGDDAADIITHMFKRPTQEKQERLCNSKRNWAVMRHDVSGDKCDAVDESRVQQ